MLRITHVAIAAAPENDKGKFTLRGLVTNARSQSANLSLHVKILSREGQPLASFEAHPWQWRREGGGALCARRSAGGGGLVARAAEALHGTHELAGGGCIGRPTGDTVWISADRSEKRKLWLNGKPVFLMGFDRHEDSPRTGMAVDLETSRQDFLAIKDAGANLFASALSPPPGELHLCDELGLLVLAEIPLCGWGVKLNDPYAGAGWKSLGRTRNNDCRRTQPAKDDLRDQNHPSIIFWSVGNESGKSIRRLTRK